MVQMQSPHLSPTIVRLLSKAEEKIKAVFNYPVGSPMVHQSPCHQGSHLHKFWLHRGEEHMREQQILFFRKLRTRFQKRPAEAWVMHCVGGGGEGGWGGGLCDALPLAKFAGPRSNTIFLRNAKPGSTTTGSFQ